MGKDNLTVGEEYELTKTEQDILEEKNLQKFLDTRKITEGKIKDAVIEYLEVCFEYQREDWIFKGLTSAALDNKISEEIREEIETLASLTFDDYLKEIFSVYEKVIEGGTRNRVFD